MAIFLQQHLQLLVVHFFPFRAKISQKLKWLPVISISSLANYIWLILNQNLARAIWKFCLNFWLKLKQINWQVLLWIDHLIAYSLRSFYEIYLLPFLWLIRCPICSIAWNSLWYWTREYSELNYHLKKAVWHEIKRLSIYVNEIEPNVMRLWITSWQWHISSKPSRRDMVLERPLVFVLPSQFFSFLSRFPPPHCVLWCLLGHSFPIASILYGYRDQKAFNLTPFHCILLLLPKSMIYSF